MTVEPFPESAFAVANEPLGECWGFEGSVHAGACLIYTGGPYLPK